MKKVFRVLLRLAADFFAPLGEDYDMECTRAPWELPDMEDYLLSFEEGLYA